MEHNSTVTSGYLSGMESKVITDYETDKGGHKEQLISDQIKQNLEIYIHVIAFISTSFFGIVTNIINIIVYWKQGLKESIAVGFFALSLSDLFLVTMSLATGSCYAAKNLLPDSNIDFPSIHYVASGAFRKMAYSLSSVFTAFLSLERCCCVVLPFKVKYIFNRSRTVGILISILVIHVLCYIPYFASQELRWKPTVYINGTFLYKLRVHFPSFRPTIEKFSYILLGIITPTVSQIVVTICAMVLIHGLRASKKFRETVTRTNPSQIDKSGDTTLSNLENGKKDTQMNLSLRDARLVKTMIFLVIILSTSNIPLLMVTYANSFVPDLNIGKAYQNTYSTCYGIFYILSSLNASVNIFVYYTTSTKYREILKSILSRGKAI